MKPLDQQLADQQHECTQLRNENARLISLLEKHGIAHSVEPPPPAPPATPPRANSHLSTEQKIALFRKLFRGRTDVYPVRWEKKDGSKAGYTPACGNEWKVNLCDKRRVKCSECGNRLLLPLADQVIYDHLAGEHVVGVYPLPQKHGRQYYVQPDARYMTGAVSTHAGQAGQLLARIEKGLAPPRVRR